MGDVDDLDGAFLSVAAAGDGGGSNSEHMSPQVNAVEPVSRSDRLNMPSASAGSMRGFACCVIAIDYQDNQRCGS
jgi:hypothetical protein